MESKTNGSDSAFDNVGDMGLTKRELISVEMMGALISASPKDLQSIRGIDYDFLSRQAVIATKALITALNQEK